MKPAESQPLQQFLPSTRSVLKNIGITHNREFEEGALRIEFYEEQAGILARKVLKDHGYTIHIRN